MLTATSYHCAKGKVDPEFRAVQKILNFGRDRLKNYALRPLYIRL